MSDRIPARTHKGRDVLLDRNIDLDSKLRTVLAQCDGKRDADQIKARFGNIVDVDAALLSLRDLGLIEDVLATSAQTAQPLTVLEAALGASTGQRLVAAAVETRAAVAREAAASPIIQAPPVQAPASAPAAVRVPTASAVPAAAVVPAAVAPLPAPVTAPPVIAAPVAQVIEPAAPEAEEVDDDPFAEWFPASMRKSKDRAA